MKPLGLFYGMGGIPLMEDKKMLLVGVHHPWSRQRPYDARDIRLLKQLFPHFKRALQTHHRLDQLTVEREALAETTDQLPRSLFTFDRQGQLLWMNRAAEAICHANDDLTIHRGALTAAVPAESQQIQRLLQAALRPTLSAGSTEGDAMVISRPSGRRSYIVLVSPLQAGRQRLDERLPAAVVFVSDPDRTPEVPLDRMMRLYGLTPAETQLALQLAGGLDLNDIAERSRRTLNTLRAQLKQVFHKTGTRRQAQLMRLMLKIEGMNVPGGQEPRPVRREKSSCPLHITQMGVVRLSVP